jgi:hypothetical protein
MYKDVFTHKIQSTAGSRVAQSVSWQLVFQDRLQAYTSLIKPFKDEDKKDPRNYIIVLYFLYVVVSICKRSHFIAGIVDTT